MIINAKPRIYSFLRKLVKPTSFVFVALVIIGWQLATFIHECGHILIGRLFGYEVSLLYINFSSAAVIIYGTPPPIKMICIAVAGSAALIVCGAILIRSCLPVAFAFLSRAWLDMCLYEGSDGSIVAEIAGTTFATVILIIEIIVCIVLIVYVPKDRGDDKK